MTPDPAGPEPKRTGWSWFWLVMWRLGECVGVLTVLASDHRQAEGWAFAIWCHLQAERELRHGRIF